MGKFNLMSFGSLDEVGIRVINKISGKSDAHYVGRGTPLGNKYRVGVDGTRTECIRKYRIWLWGKLSKQDRSVCIELDRLMNLWINNGPLILSCSCRPKTCHSQVIGACLVWHAKLAK